MWAYILRRLLYNIPIYLSIILLMMLMLRINNPVYAYLGKNATQADIDAKYVELGLDRPFVVQYGRFLRDVVTLDFSEKSWELRIPIGEMLRKAVMPSLYVTVPTLIMTAIISISIALVSAYFRGRTLDRSLMFTAVIGMSISYLVYIIMGQYLGAYWLSQEHDIYLFEIQGYEQSLSQVGRWFTEPHEMANRWRMYCALPVLIGVIVGIGYDTRFYRAVMVEESNRDYITTARAKGAGKMRIMFVHMLKNAMIPIITRLMISLPFLIEGAVLVEYFFGIPGMGRTLIQAINAKDFPVIQAFTAILAAVFIISNILTDVLYAVVDPRVRLS